MRNAHLLDGVFAPFRRAVLCVALLVICAPGCGEDSAGMSCSVTDDGAGTYTLRCADGTKVSWQDGQPGKEGAPGQAGERGQAGQDGQDGKDGLSALVKLVAEPAGANCKAGGMAVQVGIDTDGSKTLDAGEVMSTQYICNGEQGEAGNDGKTTLVRLEDEPAGTNCPAGGTVVYAGIDSDGSGKLEAGEETATTYVCHGRDGTPLPPVVEGNVAIHNAADLQRYASVEEITGDLEIIVPNLKGVSLPQLKTVGGRLLVAESDQLASLALPALAIVEGTFHIRLNPVLDTIDLSLLRTIGDGVTAGVFEVTKNPKLPRCLAQGVFDALANPKPVATLTGNDDGATCP